MDKVIFYAVVGAVKAGRGAALAVLALAVVVWRALLWVGGAAVLAVLVLRALEVADSEDGLWPCLESIGADPAADPSGGSGVTRE